MKVEPSEYFSKLLIINSKETIKEACHIITFSDCADYPLPSSQYGIGVREMFYEHMKTILDSIEISKCTYCNVFENCMARLNPEKYETCYKPISIDYDKLIKYCEELNNITLFEI